MITAIKYSSIIFIFALLSSNVEAQRYYEGLDFYLEDNRKTIVYSVAAQMCEELDRGARVGTYSNNYYLMNKKKKSTIRKLHVSDSYLSIVFMGSESNRYYYQLPTWTELYNGNMPGVILYVMLELESRYKVKACIYKVDDTTSLLE